MRILNKYSVKLNYLDLNSKGTTIDLPLINNTNFPNNLFDYIAKYENINQNSTIYNPLSGSGEILYYSNINEVKSIGYSDDSLSRNMIQGWRAILRVNRRNLRQLFNTIYKRLLNVKCVFNPNYVYSKYLSISEKLSVEELEFFSKCYHVVEEQKNLLYRSITRYVFLRLIDLIHHRRSKIKNLRKLLQTIFEECIRLKTYVKGRDLSRFYFQSPLFSCPVKRGDRYKSFRLNQIEMEGIYNDITHILFRMPTFWDCAPAQERFIDNFLTTNFSFTMNQQNKFSGIRNTRQEFYRFYDDKILSIDVYEFLSKIHRLTIGNEKFRKLYDVVLLYVYDMQRLLRVLYAMSTYGTSMSILINDCTLTVNDLIFPSEQILADIAIYFGWELRGIDRLTNREDQYGSYMAYFSKN